MLEAVEIVLANNTLTFNGKHFGNHHGDQNGFNICDVSPRIFRGNDVQKVDQTFEEDTGKYILTNWKRYLDDCFTVWNSGDNNLKT